MMKITKKRSSNTLVRTPLDLYLRLAVPKNKFQVTYVWIDGTGSQLRAKSRIVDFEPANPQDLPTWSFNGSSTYQAETSNSDVFIHPVALYNDPFHLGTSNLVLCETLKYNRRPGRTNRRYKCSRFFNRTPEAAEYSQRTLFVIKEKVSAKYSRLQTQKSNYLYYKLNQRQQMEYSTNKAAEKCIPDLHLQACLHAGVKISELENDSECSDWSFSVGPSEGVTFSDDVWMARYILHRIAEDLRVEVSLESCSDSRFLNEDVFVKYIYYRESTTDSADICGAIERINGCQKQELLNDNIYDGIDLQDMDKLLPKPSLEELILEDGNKYNSLAVPWPLVSYYEECMYLNNCDPYQVCEKIERAAVSTEKLEV